jgi:hypothetical protein
MINVFLLYFAAENKNLIVFYICCLGLGKSLIKHFSINEYLRKVSLNYFHLIQNYVFSYNGVQILQI